MKEATENFEMKDVEKNILLYQTNLIMFVYSENIILPSTNNLIMIFKQKARAILVNYSQTK